MRSLSDVVSDLIAELGAVLIYDTNPGLNFNLKMHMLIYDADGCYDSNADLIVLNTNSYMSPDLVALHELVHWTGHGSRLNRYTINHGTSDMRERMQEEAIAVFASNKLMEMFNLDMAAVKLQTDAYMPRFERHGITQDMVQAEVDKAINFIMALYKQKAA